MSPLGARPGFEHVIHHSWTLFLEVREFTGFVGFEPNSQVEWSLYVRFETVVETLCFNLLLHCIVLYLHN